MNEHELMELIAELREQILGDGGHSERLTKVEGVVAVITKRLDSIDSGINKLVWMGVSAILVALVGGLTTLLDLGIKAWLFQSVLTPTPSNHQSVNVGGAAESIASQKEWLTTDEVAKKEGVDPRTVLRWIADGRIQPTPQRVDGTSWGVAKDYAVRPTTADNVGHQPTMAGAANDES